MADSEWGDRGKPAPGPGLGEFHSTLPVAAACGPRSEDTPLRGVTGDRARVGVRESKTRHATETTTSRRAPAEKRARPLGGGVWNSLEPEGEVTVRVNATPRNAAGRGHPGPRPRRVGASDDRGIIPHWEMIVSSCLRHGDGTLNLKEAVDN
jgi:hypothetical protein